MKKMIWAVDPLAEEQKFQKHFVRVVTGISKGFPSGIVQPVYVVTPPNPYIPERGLRDFFENTENAVKKQWAKLVGRAKIPGLQEPKLLVCEDFSTKAAAGRLLEYARKNDASVIAVSTHARRGLPRAILGSFSESLVLQSEIPTLVINPTTETRSNIRHILFPSDLSGASRKVFLQVLELAREAKARVTVYHKVDFIDAFTVPSLYQFPMADEYAEQDLKRREEAIESFVAVSKKAGVKVDLVLDKGKKAPGDAILARAKKLQPDLIAMASQTGPVASMLLGSVTRQVVRAAPVPTWVIHPQTVTLTDAMSAWAAEGAYLSGIR